MWFKIFYKYIAILYYLFSSSSGEVKFLRVIEAIGMPYYKLSFKLGTCQDQILYSEYKAWPAAKMNRILDIYYKSENSDILVSSVEIKLVLNNTDCLGYSNSGVGLPEFSATIFLATNMAAIFYSLVIYTCIDNPTANSFVEDESQPQLPFYTKLRQN